MIKFFINQSIDSEAVTYCYGRSTLRRTDAAALEEIIVIHPLQYPAA